jgi:hypothetical protein
MVLKVSIVSFPLETPHMARKNHLSNCVKLKPTPWSSPTGKEI